MENDELAQRDYCNVLDGMTLSMSSVRELVRSLKEKHADSHSLEAKEGISLLSLKHHLLVSYLTSLVLLSSRRALGHSLSQRTPSSQPFSDKEKDNRGGECGDLVDSMIEGRVVLEKIKTLESRMRYQIEKLVRLAEEEGSSTAKDVLDDPLAFRPNPQALIDNNANGPGSESDSDDADPNKEKSKSDGIYRPPRLAPVPYTEPSRSIKNRRAPIPAALNNLQNLDPSLPYIESTSGLGGGPALPGQGQSSRAKEIARMTEFEEENFTRLVMKKKEAKRRLRDEEDIALGGTGSLGGRGRRGYAGLEGEFADVLKSVGRSRTSLIGDGYDELRSKGKRKDALERSKTRMRDGDAFGGDEAFEEEEPREWKRGRFEKEVKGMGRKIKKSKNKLRR